MSGPANKPDAPAAAAVTLGYVLNRGWRVFGGGFGFLAFGCGGLVFGALVVPVLVLIYRDPVRRRVQVRRGLGVCMRLFVWIVSRLDVIEVRIRGAEHLLTAGAVIAPNHPTLIDVVLLLAVAPQLDCVIKGDLLRNVFLRRAVSAAGYIPNAEGPELVARCADVLRTGRSVLIFPEGTRTVPGRPPQLRRGACSIAVRADAPLVPVLIRCVPAALSKQHRWYDLPAGPLQFDIDVLAPWSARSFGEKAVAGSLQVNGSGAVPANVAAADGVTDSRFRLVREMTRALASVYRSALGFPESSTPAASVSWDRVRVPAESGGVSGSEDR